MKYCTFVSLLKSVNESESLCSLWVSCGADRLPGTTGLLHRDHIYVNKK